jgi:hypothetical protein
MRMPFFRHPSDRSNEPEWDVDEEPVAALLERYASDSLSPDEATLSRIGAVVRASYVESVMDRGVAGEFDEVPGDRGTGARHRTWSRRRVGAALFAVAILTLSTVGFATAESGPGQPFYRLRLGIETVNLPPTGSQDRLAADLARADARLNDIAGETAKSDWNGAADAASAFRQVIGSVTLPTDTTARAQAIQRLNDQLARLKLLRTRSQGAEIAQLDGAIADLSELLGIPVPVSDATAVPSSVPAERGNEGATETSGPTGEGGPERDKSPEPSQADGNGQAGDGGGDGQDGSGPGGQSGGHPDRSPKPSDGQNRWPGPSAQPSSQPSAQPSASSQPSGGH